MDLRHRRITVLGLGRSGLSATRWLSKQGAEVTVSEIKEMHELDPQVVREVGKLGVRLETGGHRPETFLDSNLIIVSPGVPHDMGPLMMAGRKGIPVLGEMELASRFMDTPILAVTGTNGKSTVTAFLGSLLKRAGHRVFVGGNIGTPLIEYVAGGRKADYAVVEVSSFQLDTAETFSPHTAVLLNISPDHLDRYPSYEAYEESKLKIFRNQRVGQYAVLNDDDQRIAQFRPSGGATVLRYGMEPREGRQAHVEGTRLSLSYPGREVFNLDLQPFRLSGRHNLENLMAGVLAALALDVEPAIIEEEILAFRGLPHRVEWVGRIRGVDFYDDSKATNVDAARRSILSFERPLLLIAGGRHKGADYAPLVHAAKGRVRKAILLGESRHLLAEAFEGVIPTAFASDMGEAVKSAFSSAQVDDVVLLTPACSSFDMFRDYTHRGTVFKQSVEMLRAGT